MVGESSFSPVKHFVWGDTGYPMFSQAMTNPHTSTKATIADVFVVLHQHPLLRTQEMRSDRLAERLSDPCVLSRSWLETPTGSITARFARFYVTDATDATDATRRPATCLELADCVCCQWVKPAPSLRWWLARALAHGLLAHKTRIHIV